MNVQKTASTELPQRFLIRYATAIGEPGSIERFEAKNALVREETRRTSNLCKSNAVTAEFE